MNQIVTNPHVAQAHDDFHEWLDECPVQWIRQGVMEEDGFGSGHFVYLFILPVEES